MHGNVYLNGNSVIFNTVLGDDLSFMQGEDHKIAVDGSPSGVDGGDLTVEAGNSPVVGGDLNLNSGPGPTYGNINLNAGTASVIVDSSSTLQVDGDFEVNSGAVFTQNVQVNDELQARVVKLE